MLVSCGKLWRKYIFQGYTDFLIQFEQYDKKLTSHFPELDSLKNIYSYTASGGGNADYYPKELILLIHYDSIRYYSIKKRIEKEAKNIVGAEDTNIIVAGKIFYFHDELQEYIPYDNKELGEKSYKRNMANMTSDLVIPYLGFDDNTATYSGLTADSKIYHIETKFGKFHDTDTTNKEESFKFYLTLPKRLKQGYSRGYALNDKQKFIEYWLIIW
ncbi:MAG TPA: hypothetical protein DD434_02835 [Bacteroidales bacterium]|nr:hypothetical protein [Bacteroidales bacterium]